MLGLKLYLVDGFSMEPSIKKNNLVLGLQNIRNLKVGDLVVFYEESLKKKLVKRISAINENELYCLGDNLISSLDSRKLGWINKKQVIGKVIFIIK